MGGGSYWVMLDATVCCVRWQAGEMFCEMLRAGLAACIQAPVLVLVPVRYEYSTSFNLYE